MKFITLLLFILIAQPISARTKRPKKERVKAKSKQSFVDHVHAKLSNDILNVATKIDNFFGTDRADDEANNTRIRLYTVSTKFEAQNPSTEGNIKLQLVLPKTQRRLQLVVDSDEDEDDQASSAAATSTAGTPSTANNNQTNPNTAQRAANATSAALRYIVDTAGIRTSFDAGLRFTDKPQVFYRVRFRRNVRLSKKWVFRPVEQIRWIQDEGHTSDTDLDFDRSINKNWSFRFQNNIFWNDLDYSIQFTNGPSWFQRITDKIGLSYNFRVNSLNTPTFAVNNYIISVGYRQLLYKNWFFGSLVPAVSFPRENNFHRTPSITLRFDAILGSI